MKKLKQPYIKLTRFKHESGFRCFEVGYILKMSKDNKVIKKQIIGTCSDHINQDYMMLINKFKPFCLNLDLTMDGYIRFFSHGLVIGWEDDIALSTATLVVKKD